MTRDLGPARQLAASFEVAFPGAWRLALAVALAVKVEPALLRRARLELEPDLDAGTESDLWFSPLIGSSSSRELVFEPDVLAVLREELRKKYQADEPALARYRAVVEMLHANEVDAIRLEERLVWLSVKGGDVDQEIEEEVLRALRTMVEDAEGGGVEMARWADRALVYLPETTRRVEAVRWLEAGAALRLGRSARVFREGSGSIDIATGAAWLQPRVDSRSTAYWVRRYRNALVFTSVEQPGATRLLLGAGDDVALELYRLEGTDETRLALVALAPEVTLALSEGRYDLLIRTASGQAFQLSGGQEASPAKRTVLLAYAEKDRAWVRRVEKALQPMASVAGLEISDHTKPVPPGGGFEAEYRERQALEADYIVVFESPAFTESPSNEVFEELVESGRTKNPSIGRIVLAGPHRRDAWFRRHLLLNEPDEPLASLDPKQSEEEIERIGERFMRWLQGDASWASTEERARAREAPRKASAPTDAEESPPFGVKLSKDASDSQKQLPKGLQQVALDIIEELSQAPDRYAERIRPIGPSGRLMVYVHPSPPMEVTFEIDPEAREVTFLHFASIRTPFKKTVFISYSHADKKWLDRILPFLKHLEGMDLVELWTDLKLRGGDAWASEIEEALSRSAVAVVLVSPNYLSSEFLARQELPKIVERSERGDLRLIWLSLDQASVEQTPLAEIKPFSGPRRPLAGLSEKKLEAELLSLSQAIMAAVRDQPQPDSHLAS